MTKKKTQGQIELIGGTPNTGGTPSPTQDAVAEMYDGASIAPTVPWGARSFADLSAAHQAHESAEAVHELTYQFGQLANNIVGDAEVKAKLPALQALAGEFLALVGKALGEVADATAEALTETASLTESEAGEILELIETDSTKGPRDPLLMDVVIIKPGWGNKRDKRYYSAEMLKRDANLFEGVKMYVTDHKPGEKSEKTEVAVIERIQGFTSDGAPIGRVVAFDPDFAEKTRNRAKAGQLSTLECSIFGEGKIRQGTAPDGADGYIVESLTKMASVDWVSKAGAGGYALALAESAEGTMKPDEQEGGAAPVAPPVAEAAPVETVTIAESEAEPVAEVGLVFLTEADVLAELAGLKLPDAMKAKIAKGQFQAGAEVKVAAESEMNYLKEVFKAGKPLNFNDAPRTAAPTKSKEARVREVLAFYS